jgi:tetratricopeptide (TPR) repeat protein
MSFVQWLYGATQELAGGLATMAVVAAIGAAVTALLKTEAWYRSHVAALGGLCGAVVAASGYFQLWRGDRQVVTWLASALGYALVLGVILWFRFSTTISALDGNKRVSQFPQLRRLTQSILIATCLASLVGAVWLHRRHSLLRKSFVVLVADFVGPDPDRHQVTEEILDQLRQSLGPIGNSLVASLHQAISEQQGTDHARLVGRRYQADLVLWGRYQVADSELHRIVVHVENLTATAELPEGTYRRVVVSQPQTSNLGVRFARDMTGLTLLIAAVADLEVKDYPAAMKRLHRAFESEPSPEIQALVFYYRGLAFLSMDRREEAFADLSEAIARETGPSVEAYEARGIALRRMHRFDEAISDLTKAIKLGSARASAYVNRGDCWFWSDKPGEAIEDYSLAIQKNPNLAVAYHNRGVVRAALNEINEALADFSTATDIEPNWAVALMNRGVAKSQLGRIGEAVADLSAAIRADPKLGLAYLNRGEAYLAGIEQYYLNPRQSAPKAARAEAERAVADYSQGLKINPDLVTTYVRRCLAYVVLGRKDEAIQDGQKALSRSSNPEIQESAGQCLRFADAIP